MENILNINTNFQYFSMKSSSIYIHVPYCASKCIYCDFFSGGIKGADWQRFTDALINELQERKNELTVTPDTLYMGGGTPSLIPDDSFSRLVEAVNEYVNPAGEWREFTIEVNPDDVTEEICRVWKSVGVNRVSIGLQSLNDRELRAIRRRHDSQTALMAYGLLTKYFQNVSVDLMFGIPGQTLESWAESVKAAIRLRPQHLSAYSLMLEEGTPLTVLYNQGRVELPGERECDDMWRLLTSELTKAGYEHYEISNYCLPGWRSVHNSRYWFGCQYLGLGPAAHSYDGHRVRRSNPWNISSYLSRFSGTGEKPFYSEEILSEEERLEEHIMTRLRVKDGIDVKSFCNEFGENRWSQLLHNARTFLADGKMKLQSDSLSLTTEGIMISDYIILSLNMFPEKN